MATTQTAAAATAELLKIAQDHLRQYAAYAEEMRAIGRGMTPSSPWSPELLAGILADAIEKGGR